VEDDACRAAIEDLRPEFGPIPFELRFSATGEAAVRIAAVGGPVAARHAEPAAPDAPWSATASCGAATGWLLAAAPPADPVRAGELLDRVVARLAAQSANALAAERGRVAGELLTRLTHRLRTDVSSLLMVTEGALRGLFAEAEVPPALAEVRAAADGAQRRLSDARRVSAVLHPAAACEPEPIAELLCRELEGAGAPTSVADADGERARALLPGQGWAVCARLLADALAHDARLEGAAVTVAPDPAGWRVTATDGASGAEPAAWDERTVGALEPAGLVLAVSGGAAEAAATRDGTLQVILTVPAAPSSA
jgi:signal transduction histidine kinase